MRLLLRRLTRTALTSVAVLLLVFAAAQPSSTAQEELIIVESETAGHEVEVAVVAPVGLRGEGIDQNPFQVEIDGELVLSVAERVQGEELDVVLLVDVSGSMTPEALAAAKTAGASFISQLPERARVAVVSFGDTVQVVQPFTTDIDQSTATLASLVAGGETALHAGVVEAARQFQPNVDSIRTIVLLSDGGNTVDESSLGNAQAALISSEATLHAISIETDEANPAELDALAEASGGSVARVEQVDAIEELYRSIAADLGSQYRLRFVAPGSGAVTVTIKAQLGTETLAQASYVLTLPIVAPPQPVATTAPLGPAVIEAPNRATASEVNRVVIEADDNPLLKWGAIAALAIAIAVIAGLIITPGEGHSLRKPKQQFGAVISHTRPRAGAVIDRVTGGVDGLLQGNRVGGWLSSLLDAAGWKIRNAEFAVLVCLILVVAFFTGAIGSYTLALSLMFIAMMTIGLVLYLLASRRRSAFADQLNGTLQMMAGGLRTGYSLPQVFSLVAQEAEAPTSEEFSRIVVEMRLGRDMVDASYGVASRLKNEDFAWTTGAMEIAREVGGDLAEVLDNVAETVRTRERVRRQILALSAEGRVSAWILMAMPFPIFFWQLFVNRDYTMLLFTTGLGRMIFFGGVAGLVIGGIWMNRLIQVKY